MKYPEKSVIRFFRRLRERSLDEWLFILLVMTAFSMPFHIELTRYLTGGVMGVWLLRIVIPRLAGSKFTPPRLAGSENMTPRLAGFKNAHPRLAGLEPSRLKPLRPKWGGIQPSGVKHFLPQTTVTVSSATRGRQSLLYIVIAFYLLHVVSLWTSSDFGHALFDLERKLTILLLPLAFSTLSALRGKRKDDILASFIAANLAISLFYIGFYLGKLSHPEYFRDFVDYPLYWIYTDFALLNQSTYYALHMELCVAFLFYLYHRPHPPVSRRWIAGLIVFFTLMIFLVSSRAGIIGLVVLFAYTIVHYARGRKLKGVLTAGLVVVTVLGLTNYRFDNYLDLGRKLLQGHQVSHQELIENDALRFLIWETSLELSREHCWWGMGTGDVQKELNRAYQRRNIRQYMDHNFNPHNQYLSTYMGTGFFGLILLLMLLIWPLIISFREKDYLAAGLILLFVLHFMFESMLNRLPGILPFAFFYGLLVMNGIAVKSSKTAGSS